MKRVLLAVMLAALVAGDKRLIAQDQGSAQPGQTVVVSDDDAPGGQQPAAGQTDVCTCENCGGDCGQAFCPICGAMGALNAVCGHCHRSWCCLCAHCHHPPHHGNRAAQYRASQQPWHGGYYYTQWGAPVALVIPPTAEKHTDYSWGVPSTRISTNDHQFQRPFPGAAAGWGSGRPNYGFLPTPYYPSDTNQFGVYYVRGPW